MSRPITWGDTVELWWALPGNGRETTEPAIVLSTPSGPGDLFYFQMHDGSVIGVNGNSSGFEGMRLLEPKGAR